MAGEKEGAVMEFFGYNVDLMDEIGRGGFGTVYRGYGSHDNQPVAMKKVSKMDKQKASTEAVRFHYMMDRIDHENVLKVYDVKSWKDSMWIIMEFCDLGDLNNFFMRNREVHDTNIKPKMKLMMHIANGIAFLHNKRIVHRDIKPGNILLSTSASGTIIKLGDFGLSKILDPDDMTSAMSSNVGTLVFKAPEFWNRDENNRIRYHRNVDVYSAGLTFTAMLQARPGKHLVPRAECTLYPSENSMTIGFADFTRMVNGEAEISVVEDKASDDDDTKWVKELVRNMTRVSPSERFSSGRVADMLSRMSGLDTFTIDYEQRRCSNSEARPDENERPRVTRRTRHNTAPACLVGEQNC